MNNRYPMEYHKYDSQYPGPKEHIGWIFWDSQQYISGTTLNLTYFTAIQATIDDGNMRTAGQMPGTQGFLIRAFRFIPKLLPEATDAAATANTQTGQLDDITQLLNDGTFRLVVGAKEYHHCPLWCIPAGGGAKPMFQTGDVDVVVDSSNNGMQSPRMVYTLSIPLFIPPLINFHISLRWPTALTLALGDTWLTVAMDGDIVRPVQ